MATITFSDNYNKPDEGEPQKPLMGVEEPALGTDIGIPISLLRSNLTRVQQTVVLCKRTLAFDDLLGEDWPVLRATQLYGPPARFRDLALVSPDSGEVLGRVVVVPDAGEAGNGLAVVLEWYGDLVALKASRQDDSPLETRLMRRAGEAKHGTVFVSEAPMSEERRGPFPVFEPLSGVCLLCRRPVPHTDHLAHFRRHRMDTARNFTGTGAAADPFVYVLLDSSAPPPEYSDMETVSALPRWPKKPAGRKQGPKKSALPLVSRRKPSGAG